LVLTDCRALSGIHRHCFVAVCAQRNRSHIRQLEGLSFQAGLGSETQLVKGHVMYRSQYLVPAIVLLWAAQAVQAQESPAHNWAQFSDTAAASTSSLTADGIGKLRGIWSVSVPESVDGSPLYVRSVTTTAGITDVVIVATQSGRVIAYDAGDGNVIWSVPAPVGPRWTTSSPALDPNGQFLYAYGLDGYVHKRTVATGEEVRGGGWPVRITKKPAVEKGSSAVSVATAASGKSYLYMTIAAYPEPGDDGDYQGHLVSIDLSNGSSHVFNAACSDRDMLFEENGGPATDCPNAQSGIWARAGAVYEPRTNRVYVTTGNGVYDGDRGGFNWGTSVVALAPDGDPGSGVPLDSYTPLNHQFLTDADLDLSSTTVTPLVLPSDSTLPPLAVQGGKDGRLRLLNLADLSGQGGPGHLGGEYQIIDPDHWSPILTRPAVWLEGTNSYVAVANGQGITTFRLDTTAPGKPALTKAWTVEGGSNSPIYANGMLFCVRSHELFALDARSGELLWSDPEVDLSHWQSPILVDDSLYVADATTVRAYSTTLTRLLKESARRRLRLRRE
jgi:outer membrane protein assembly factor BamB